MRNCVFALLVAGMAVLVAGCAVTDYSGFIGHRTTVPSKLYSFEIAFEGFGEDLDGTYAYTVEYNNRRGQGAVEIISYRNPVPGFFTRELVIDVNGRGLNGSRGAIYDPATGALETAGRFRPYFRAVDPTGGTNQPDDCEFDANLRPLRDDDDDDGGTSVEPGVLLCVSTNEEVDTRDAELAVDSDDDDLDRSFSNIDELFSLMLKGELFGGFTLDLTGVALNGVELDIETCPIRANTNGFKVTNLTIVNGPEMQSLIQTLLNNTRHMEPVQVGLRFEGGMTVDAPNWLAFGFNHTVLSDILAQY